MGSSRRRRGLLAAGAAGLAALAGCAGLSLGSEGGDGESTDEQMTPTETGETEDTATPTVTPTPSPTPTPDPRRNVVELSVPDSFPVEERTVVPRDGYRAYHVFAPEGGLRLSYTFRATDQEDFDMFGFDPAGFETYAAHVIEGAETTPEPIANLTEEDTGGLVKRLSVSLDAGEYYLTLDHTDYGSAANRRGVAGDVEMDATIKLL